MTSQDFSPVINQLILVFPFDKGAIATVGVQAGTVLWARILTVVRVTLRPNLRHLEPWGAARSEGACIQPWDSELRCEVDRGVLLSADVVTEITEANVPLPLS
jgi:hypothetical protein